MCLGFGYAFGAGIFFDQAGDDEYLITHEYAIGASVDGTQFFSGKRIVSEGFATNIIRTDRDQLLRYTVDSTQGMAAGDEFVICDVQRGDTFAIPTSARLQVSPDGSVSGSATTDVTVKQGGKAVATVEP